MKLFETATSRRSFLSGALCGVAATVGISTGRLDSLYGTSANSPDTLFLTWQRDPTTTMTIQWIGPSTQVTKNIVKHAKLGSDAYTLTTPTKRIFPFTDLCIYRVELVSLTSGAEYQFRIGDSLAVHRFRTMPEKATNEFTFVSGGDCGTNEHVIANNIVVAKQNPMFALIGGDLAYDNGTHSATCLKFIRNYSRYMIDQEGRHIPMIVCIGNHDVRGHYNCKRSDGQLFFALHDGLFAERSFATLDFGDYLSLVLLDTGHVAAIDGEQTSWLDRCLAARADYPHLIAVNHVPAYPSFRNPDSNTDREGTGSANREHWVPLFEKRNVTLVLEHHDHTFKRTRPLLNGHVDKRGVVYLGDGSWGQIRAPKAPEQRNYLAVAEQQYHLTLHRLEGNKAFHLALSEFGSVMDISTTEKRAAL